MKYKLLNNTIGWFVFGLSLLVYVLTLEPTASYWDCGEFIAVARHLQTPHPPGAPIFSLLGRFFSMLSGDGWSGFSYSETAAYWINMVSAVSSAFTSLFLFWTITILAKKLLKFEGEGSLTDKIVVFGAGFVGAMACTFCDSIWFSAVEAEVYAISLFFTSFVLWAMLKRAQLTDQVKKDRFMILIAYMVGLSIGVHLLNLVAIPALALIVYFEKEKPTWKGGLIAFFASIVILYAILSGLPGLTSIAFWFDRLFNSFGAPFNFGAFVFLSILLGGLLYGIFYSIKNSHRVLNVSLLSVSFILIGFFSYFVIIIRSGQNPSIDENDPENLANFISYLNREQYGDRPLLKGPQFNIDFNQSWQNSAQNMGVSPTSDDLYTKKSPRYRQGEDGSYVPYDEDAISYNYPSEYKSLLPRMYSSDPSHVSIYKRMITEYHDGLYPLEYTQGEKIDNMDNFKYMFEKQLGDMYWRYFLWNFKGRERQEQYAASISPFAPSNEELPQILKHPARNNFFMIPLILGLIGLVYQLFKDQLNFTVILTLFVFTGIAIIIYLNAPPTEPRERDYAYAGSYMAFCIWIGLSVIAIYQGLVYTIKNKLGAASIAVAACMMAPTIMGAVGWDDHDRSRRYFSVDSAKNLLNSCEPNGILFTAGDNDTFPLWYVQEVEGFRTDVRVCNLSLLNTDWYVDQMKRPSHKSAPLPITFEHNSYIQGTLDYLPFKLDSRKNQSRPYYVKNGESYNYDGAKDPGMSLDAYVTAVRNLDPSVMESYGDKIMPMKMARKFRINLDTAQIARLAWVPNDLKNRLETQLVFDNGEGAIYKKDLIMMDIINSISKSGWDRPIYFSTTAGQPGGENYLGIRDHLQQEGLAYRLLPVNAGSRMNKEITHKILTDKFFYGERPKEKNTGLMDTTITYTDDYSRMVSGIQMIFLQLGMNYVQDGQKEKAKELFDFYHTKISEVNFPWDRFAPTYLDLVYQVYGAEKGDAETKRITKLYTDVLKHYATSVDDAIHRNDHIQNAVQILGEGGIIQILAKNQRTQLSQELSKEINTLMSSTR
jgi:hypothetical protein